MGYPGAIMFFYLIGVFVFFMLPLFLLGLSVYKCAEYAYPKLKGSTPKNAFLPIFSGGLTVACGFLYLVLVGGKEDPGFRNSLTAIFIVWISTGFFLFNWFLYSLEARRKQTKTEGNEQPSSRENGLS
jgi:hypothetical protein